jgi:pimeloyl-ACP methyl ester carboxylesterase
LGADNRTEAISLARAAGLLTPEGNLSTRFTSTRPAQSIHLINSFDGSRIAYAVAGQGQPLLKAANYMGHLNFDWDSPVWSHWLQELTRGHQLVRYDERGSGMSDWKCSDLSFEAWVKDLEKVADAAKLDRFLLFGMSQGGAVAVAFAARHPERVSGLVLHGAYARGWLRRDLTPEQKAEEKLLIDLMRVGWDQENPAFRQVFAMQLCPDASGEQLHALEEQMLISASPENAVRLESEMHKVDVRELASLVRAPTLVFHSKQDGAVPFKEGAFLSSLIPNAQLVGLESRNHLLTEGEPAWKKFQSHFQNFTKAIGPL